MARAPRASVGKTSGQGISRLGYQKARSLTNRGPQTPMSGIVPRVSSGTLGGGGKSYAKTIGGPPAAPVAPPMNVSYGDTMDPTNLQDIAAADPKRPPRNPPKGLNLGPGKVPGGLNPKTLK